MPLRHSCHCMSRAFLVPVNRVHFHFLLIFAVVLCEPAQVVSMPFPLLATRLLARSVFSAPKRVSHHTPAATQITRSFSVSSVARARAAAATKTKAPAKKAPAKKKPTKKTAKKPASKPKKAKKTLRTAKKPKKEVKKKGALSLDFSTILSRLHARVCSGKDIHQA